MAKLGLFSIPPRARARVLPHAKNVARDARARATRARFLVSLYSTHNRCGTHHDTGAPSHRVPQIARTHLVLATAERCFGTPSRPKWSSAPASYHMSRHAIVRGAVRARYDLRPRWHLEDTPALTAHDLGWRATSPVRNWLHLGGAVRRLRLLVRLRLLRLLRLLRRIVRRGSGIGRMHVLRVCRESLCRRVRHCRCPGVGCCRGRVCRRAGRCHEGCGRGHL